MVCPLLNPLPCRRHIISPNEKMSHPPPRSSWLEQPVPPASYQPALGFQPDVLLTRKCCLAACASSRQFLFLRGRPASRRGRRDPSGGWNGQPGRSARQLAARKEEAARNFSLVLFRVRRPLRSAGLVGRRHRLVPVLPIPIQRLRSPPHAAPKPNTRAAVPPSTFAWSAADSPASSPRVRSRYARYDSAVAFSSKPPP